MPQIQKQNAKPKPSNGAAKRPAGGILSRAVAAADLARSPLKVLLYGANRTGKTTLACQFTKPLLLITFEQTATGGAESIRRVDGVEVLQEGVHFHGRQGTLDLIGELAASPQSYATVVVDGATAVEDMCLRDVRGVDKLPNQNSWGEVTGDQYRARSEMTRDVLQPFVDLPMDTIIIAQEKDHNPPREERVTASGKVSPDMRPAALRGVHKGSYIAAALGGAGALWLQNRCDHVWRLFFDEEIVTTTVKVAGKETKQERATGRFTRWLRLQYHLNYAAGPRTSYPENVPEEIQNPTGERLLEILRGG